MELSPLSVILLLAALIHHGHTQVRPTPAVTITPNPAFRGETVTLRCDQQGRGQIERPYIWKKDNSLVLSSSSQDHVISPVADSHSGDYTCSGTVTGTSRYSHTSAPVRLTVSDLPTATLTTHPTSPLFTGESVTLTCNISNYDGWTYQWETQNNQHQWSAVSQSVYQPVNSNTVTIRGDYVGNGGQYRCRGERPDRPGSSQNSTSVTLTVTALLRPTLTVEPKWSPVFTGESVTLKCEIGTLDGWTYQWEKQNNQHGWPAVSHPVSHAVNGDTLTISAGAVATVDYYRCRGQLPNRPASVSDSDPVTLTVAALPRATLTVEPKWRPMFTGESVTLKCEIQSNSDWTYQWYKGSSRTAVSQSQLNTFIISSVEDQDQYWCRGERSSRPTSSQDSNKVTLTVRDLPTATLTTHPTSPLFTGESVTLKCKISHHYGWTYQWEKHYYQHQWFVVSQSVYHTVNGNTLTIRGDDVVTGDQYRCRGERPDRPRSSHYSNSVTLTVTETPTPALTITPNPAFRGETVTLRCVIGGGVRQWTYNWFKDGQFYNSRTAPEYKIRSVTDSEWGEYYCYGTVTRTSVSSHYSAAVTLTVSETPKPELSSSFKGAALIGNPVTLYCKLNQSAGWRFYWSKHTQTPENETTTETHSYAIRSVSFSDGGQYWCRAGRGNPVYYTNYSDALWVHVTDTSLLVTLIVHPSRSQHFTNDSLSLSCERQSNSAGWRVRRYTHSERVSDCSSGWGSVTGSTCNISSLSSSHTGVYWCESESGGSSNPVNITVHNGSVILDSPVHPVTEGYSLTLHCLYRHTKPSNLTADFYKDGSFLQTQTTGEMTIRTVSKSDEGLYHCKLPEKGESPQSWISVRSNGSMLAKVSIGLGLALLLIITLCLIWFYKEKRGKQQNINQTEHPASTPLQDDDPSAQSSNGTYEEIMHTKKELRQKDKAVVRPTDVTYSQIEMKTRDNKDKAVARPTDVMYSQIEMKTRDNKDAEAQPGEVTYADIKLKPKPKKKPKKQKDNLHKGQSSAGDETVYSELK
ncbi:Fc receptor-like protein 5 isoform X2 [Salminus brasiliensis]|uniref:Fc receptor-like protein 5 isoform X2 n=1 Tax=Salminus brasiliensis TaxID=930266 RepID=UPI003B83479F